MKNIKNNISNGFKYEKTLFGVSYDGWSVDKLTNPDGRIVVALVKDDVIAINQYIYRFESEMEFEAWLERIYEGDGHGRLCHRDADLIFHAYPVLLDANDE